MLKSTVPSGEKNQGRSFLGARVALFGAFFAALVAAVFFRDFAVDDALISVRYARNVASGVGWRFNHAGPVTDGVTPLPWPMVLAVLVKLTNGSAWSTFVAARVLGCVAHASTVALLLRGIVKAKPSLFIWTIVVATLLLSLPTSAYAASGMETPVAVLLATAGALAWETPDRAACFLGLAAAFRPELAPWAMVVAGGYASKARSTFAQRARAVGIAFAPFFACAVIREIAFGSPAPLAVMA